MKHYLELLPDVPDAQRASRGLFGTTSPGTNESNDRRYGALIMGDKQGSGIHIPPA